MPNRRNTVSVAARKAHDLGSALALAGILVLPALAAGIAAPATPPESKGISPASLLPGRLSVQPTRYRLRP